MREHGPVSGSSAAGKGLLMRYDVLLWSVDVEHLIAKDIGPP
jgi:hypothetical protein